MFLLIFQNFEHTVHVGFDAITGEFTVSYIYLFAHFYILFLLLPISCVHNLVFKDLFLLILVISFFQSFFELAFNIQKKKETIWRIISFFAILFLFLVWFGLQFKVYAEFVLFCLKEKLKRTVLFSIELKPFLAMTFYQLTFAQSVCFGCFVSLILEIIFFNLILVF